MLTIILFLSLSQIYTAILTVSYANAFTLPQQAMSNDKPLRVYALFLRFSERRYLRRVSASNFVVKNTDYFAQL